MEGGAAAPTQDPGESQKPGLAMRQGAGVGRGVLPVLHAPASSFRNCVLSISLRTMIAVLETRLLKRKRR